MEKRSVKYVSKRHFRILCISKWREGSQRAALIKTEKIASDVGNM